MSCTSRTTKASTIVLQSMPFIQSLPFHSHALASTHLLPTMSSYVVVPSNTSRCIRSWEDLGSRTRSGSATASGADGRTSSTVRCDASDFSGRSCGVDASIFLAGRPRCSPQRASPFPPPSPDSFSLLYPPPIASLAEDPPGSDYSLSAFFLRPTSPMRPGWVSQSNPNDLPFDDLRRPRSNPHVFPVLRLGGRGHKSTTTNQLQAEHDVHVCLLHRLRGSKRRATAPLE